MSDSSCTVGVLWQHLPWTEHEHNLSGTWAWSPLLHLVLNSLLNHKHSNWLRVPLLHCSTPQTSSNHQEISAFMLGFIVYKATRWRVLEFSWCCSTCMIQQKLFLNNTLTNFGAIQGDKINPYSLFLSMILWLNLNRNQDKNLFQN